MAGSGPYAITHYAQVNWTYSASVLCICECSCGPVERTDAFNILPAEMASSEKQKAKIIVHKI